MLDHAAHQAWGLQGLLPQSAPRLMALASHGSQQDELPLLWALCATLVRLGYSVAVLDGTTTETDRNPGLRQLLEDTCWRPDGHGEPMSWSVLPSARGLQQLCTLPDGAEGALDPLCPLFQNYGVVVLYARAGMLVPLLQGSAIEPLLAVSAQAMSPVTAYQALKALVLNAQLKPTLAAIGPEPGDEGPDKGYVAAQKLQTCAMTFLGYQVDCQPLAAAHTMDGASEPMSRLALRLLESAVALPRKHWAGVR
jgi:hypothetical protein